MPLPKPPSRKGDLLQSIDYEVQAAPKANKRTTKARADDTPAQTALDLDDGGAAMVARAPAQQAALLSTPPVVRPPAAVAPPTVAAAPAAAPAPRPRKPRSNGPAKLFVLDTNVLMHDPMSLFRFEEHDVFLPMITLEELDGHKKGMTEVARNARQVSRDLDALASFTARNGAIDTAAGIELAKTGHREAGGKLYFQTMLLDVKLPPGLPQGKADNQILGVVQSLREQQQASATPRDVVL